MNNGSDILLLTAGGLHWAAVVIYAAATILLFLGFAFQKDRCLKTGVILIICGTLFHTAALGVRWAAVGHGPFMKKYEILSSYVLIAMYMYLLVIKKRPGLRAAGIFVMPVSLIIMGLALTSSSAAVEMPESFNYVWIVLHVLFAQASYGAGLIGAGLSLLYLMKEKAQNKGTATGWYQNLPSLEKMDKLSYRFHGFAFMAIGVMTASGAVWANYAWGRYWGWDPVENWSLISWLLYGIYLHLRRIHGWAGKRAAWFSFAAFLVLLFILAGIGWVYQSVHAPYFI
ncbi:cytochrome c biogenesis protein CcsA [Phosphitispora sp. TUW77]|uniref:cytochrome c biogenesis protein CcsA n=1 Tax=Phosphitispora sp. TUW77 TaxID=3152361 RepID=UPI003AB3B108